MERVLVSLAPGVEAPRVVEALRALGCRAAAPTKELPDVVVVHVAAKKVRAFLRDAAAVPGVLVAEPDALSYTQAAKAAGASRAAPTSDQPHPRGEPALPPGWSSTEPSTEPE